MKHYEKMAELGCFSRDEICGLLGNNAAAHSILYDYTQKGLIERVRRDLYVALDYETKCPLANRYAIASHISDGSYITHHSAFEYFGCANQVYYEVYVSDCKPFTEFEYNSVTYKYVSPSIESGISLDKGLDIRTTDVERTILDGIKNFDKIGGLEELLNCLGLISSVNEDTLLNYLSEYHQIFLYQKTGYILSHFCDQMHLHNIFFEKCRNEITATKRYLSSYLNKKELMLDKKWNLFVPKDLLSIIGKGVPSDYYEL